MGFDSNTTNLAIVVFRKFGLLNTQVQCTQSTTFKI